MEYRIVSNGNKFKVQVRKGIWPIRWWFDIGENGAGGMWVPSYYINLTEARKRIAKHIKYKDKKQWQVVAGEGER